MESPIKGSLVRSFGRTLARSLAVMVVGIAVIAVVPVLLEEGGVISRTASFWLYGVGLVAVLALMLNEMWTRGTAEVRPSGLAVTEQRLFQRTARATEVPWGTVQTYRFDTDAQGRPYVQVTPDEGPDLSFYGSAGAEGQAQFAAFEGAFRAAVAAHNAGGGMSAPAEAAAITEAPSFYAGQKVRLASVAFLVLALGLVAALFSTGHEQAWRAVWLLLIALGFAARVWLPREG